MTIIEEKKERIRLAKEHGYRYLTYTYSTLKAAQEEEGAFTVAHGDSTAKNWIEWDIIPEDELYTCCIYDLKAKNGRTIKIIEKGGSPLVARKNAMAALAELILGDTIDHSLGKSARDAVQVLTVTQLIASGDPSLKLVSDAKYQMTGEFLKNWLTENSLSQNRAAELCSVNPKTFRRWVAGKPPMPRGMWELLKIKSRQEDGTINAVASIMGKKGGSRTSEAKTLAARENAKKPRPRKTGRESG